MVSKACSAAHLGVEALPIEVEAQVGDGLRRFTIVGLPDSSLREAKERVRCAIESCGFVFPSQEVVVSLAPASLPKSGAAFDLGIALSVLAASRQIKASILSACMFVGELALDGEVKSVEGVLQRAMLAKRRGIRLVTSPRDAKIAATIDGVQVYGLRSLLEVVAFLHEPDAVKAVPPAVFGGGGLPAASADFSEVIGQASAKRAFEIAASGGHNVLLVGPPGAGKSMLAERFHGILPLLDREAALEVAMVYASASGSEHRGRQMRERAEVLNPSPPFRSPHHTSSSIALLGGGANPMPGEISLAHRGVLFLDEFAEFRRDVVESLREPLERGEIEISRARYRMRLPANFILVAAMNPCPCGKSGAEVDSGTSLCSCSTKKIERYRRKISGPVLDRIDLQSWVSPVPIKALSEGVKGESSQVIRERVLLARSAQRKRFGRSGRLNSDMSTKELRARCSLAASSAKLLEQAAKRYSFTARGYTRVLKVARTIADLEQSDSIETAHLAEALSYRIDSRL